MIGALEIMLIGYWWGLDIRMDLVGLAWFYWILLDFARFRGILRDFWGILLDLTGFGWMHIGY